VTQTASEPFVSSHKSADFSAGNYREFLIAGIFAEWNPISTLTHAVRVRFGNLPAETPDPTSWPLQNAMLYSLGWAVLLILVFAPIATRLYQRTEKR
jgi:hypothetical protein